MELTFRWRTEPAVVGVRFEAPARWPEDVSAVIAPVFPVSMISANLVDSLLARRFDLRRVGPGNARCSIEVGGKRVGPLTFAVRSAPMPLRTEAHGNRALLVLGLDFLSLYGECRLRFEGEQATLALGV